tara:strand:- start:734 stop:1066 length:333 start_codon:yes stop_codon:yes gene_type:complete
MPDAFTQTDEFVILDKQYQKKYLSIAERREYYINYKIYKKEKSDKQRKEYARTYQRQYHRLKMKYDDDYRQWYIDYYKEYNALKKEFNHNKKLYKLKMLQDACEISAECL